MEPRPEAPNPREDVGTTQDEAFAHLGERRGEEKERSWSLQSSAQILLVFENKSRCPRFHYQIETQQKKIRYYTAFFFFWLNMLPI